MKTLTNTVIELGEGGGVKSKSIIKQADINNIFAIYYGDYIVNFLKFLC